jgi:hypothetical protein
MLGPKQEAQGALFYEFSIDDHVPHVHTWLSLLYVHSHCVAKRFVF